MCNHIPQRNIHNNILIPRIKAHITKIFKLKTIYLMTCRIVWQHAIRRTKQNRVPGIKKHIKSTHIKLALQTKHIYNSTLLTIFLIVLNIQSTLL